MSTSTNVVRLRQPEEIDDPLTDVLRAGARRLLAQAVELEAEAFLAGMQDLKLPDGRDRLVRHGHGPERMIQTGIGPVAVSRVKIRDRGAATDQDRVRFSSSILPKWARRTRSLDALLPVLYLRGVSTGDFQEALAALLGRDAPNLSPSVIARLTALDGWARVEAARQTGLERLPCVLASHLTAAERRLLRLAVNRLGEQGQWDLGELKLDHIATDLQIQLA